MTDVSPNLAQGGQPEKEGRLHQCLECGRTFASAALLLHHSKEMHGRERIHVCPVCRKAFKRATHLKVRPRPTPASVTALRFRSEALHRPRTQWGQDSS